MGSAQTIPQPWIRLTGEVEVEKHRGLSLGLHQLQRTEKLLQEDTGETLTSNISKCLKEVNMIGNASWEGDVHQTLPLQVSLVKKKKLGHMLCP